MRTSKTGGPAAPWQGPVNSKHPKTKTGKPAEKTLRHRIKKRNTDPRSRSPECRSRCRNQWSRSPEYAPVALHAMNCVCSDRFVRHYIAPPPHPTPVRRCAPCKRWQRTPQSGHGDPGPGAAQSQRLYPASDSTTRKRAGVQHRHCRASTRATRLRNSVARTSRPDAVKPSIGL